MKRGEIILWLAVFAAVLSWSAARPHDYPTWLMEVAPALAGLAILAALWRRFQFTRLVLWLILAQSVVLMVGGHYTYAEVPFFDWWQGRNNYDKLGHFFQGFVPALIVREVALRLNLINGRGWLVFFVTAVCLAISALYELIEWAAAVCLGQGADAFLGTQGYEWDTQTDMLMALIGAVTALLCLAKIHNRQIDKLPRRGYADNERSA